MSDADSDNEPPTTQHKEKKKSDNEAEVQEILDDFKSKYGTQYVQFLIQYGNHWSSL